MKEIGGYFELEMAKSREHHDEAIKLNSGRNAFRYILKAQNIKKVYIPVFICDSILEPLEELGICYKFYNVDEKFEIVQEIELRENERLLYVNYFSLKSNYISDLSIKFEKKLIVDNTQAFFEKPIENIDSIYSPRKYFGVSDGGYLYTQNYLKEDLETDISYNSSIHLLGRVDDSASGFYVDYQKIERGLIGKPLKKMSRLTSGILASIDYEEVKLIRERNFYYVHSKLKDLNKLNIEISDLIPFVYPLKIDLENIRERLTANKIYVAKYWSEVLDRTQASKIEKDLVTTIIPLPIDQRYTVDDMKRIVDVVKG